MFLEFPSVAHCPAGGDGVEIDAAFWADRGAGEPVDIVPTEVAMPVERGGPLVFIEDRIPDAFDGFLSDLDLDRGGGFEDDLEPVGPFGIGFDGFGADASDG